MTTPLDPQVQEEMNRWQEKITADIAKHYEDKLNELNQKFQQAAHLQTHTPKRKALPLPPKYSGKKKEYESWSQEMRAKIRIDGDFYDNDPIKLWWLINSCLGDSPRLIVATFVKSGGRSGAHDPDVFMAYLDSIYKDRTLQARAARDLRRMHQPDKASLATFIPKFEQTLVEAGGATWPDGAKITFLEGALNSELQRSLITVDLPVDDYPGWVRRVQEVASRLERFDANKQRGTPSEKDLDGDTKMAGVNKVKGRRHQQVSDTRGSNARQGRDRSSGGHKNPRTCYYCEKAGHIARFCEQRWKDESKTKDKFKGKKGINGEERKGKKVAKVDPVSDEDTPTFSSDEDVDSDSSKE